VPGLLREESVVLDAHPAEFVEKPYPLALGVPTTADGVHYHEVAFVTLHGNLLPPASAA
jgi:hypothetical protein